MANLSLKLDNMRKAQSFTIYPFKAGETKVTIQSGTRIGQFDVETGVGVLSKNVASGAYFMHLNSFAGAKDYTLNAVDLQAVKMLIFSEGTELVIAKGLMTADNSGAATILN